MSKIIQLTAENVKRLRAVNITPAGNVVILGGANGAGKSSVLDCITMALGGKGHAAAVPVRNGQEFGRIVLDLGDIVVKRTFTPAGDTALTVTAKDGAKYASPQTMLDKLVGTLTFDPLAFTRLAPKEQVSTLMALVGVDFTEMDGERAALYAQRTVANKDLERYVHIMAGLPRHPDAPDSPDAEVSAQDILDELQTIQAENAAVDAAEKDLLALHAAAAAIQKDLTRNADDIADLEARLQKLRTQRQALTDQMNANVIQVAEMKANLDNLQRHDPAEAKARLAAVEQTNQKVRANVIRADAEKALASKTTARDLLTAQIADIDKAKAQILADAKFPIDGLGFTDLGVTWQGLPFEQASSAAQLRASVAIAAAMNPKLRVMVVKDGSLLDAASLALLEEMAEKHDLQIWMERVSTGSECSIIIEDGAVQAQPAAAP